MILFVANASIYQIPERGGKPAAATQRRSDREWQEFPTFLDRTHFLFYSEISGKWGLATGSLDSTTVLALTQPGFGATVAAKDHLLYVSSGWFTDAGPLSAQRLDLQKLQPTGNSVRIVDRVALDRRYPALAAVSGSEAGRVAYRTDGAVERQFVWRDRTGHETNELGPVDKATPSRVRISPDGQTVAFYRSVGHGTGSLWLIDVAGAAPARRFRNATQSLVWSPNGDEVVWGGLPEFIAAAGLFRQPLNTFKGTGSWVVPALPVVSGLAPQDWSDNGFLLYQIDNGANALDLLAMPLVGGPPANVAAGPADESNGRFSPNGKWVAYQSDEVGGRNEIFVQPFPGLPSDRRKVSLVGGTSPHWGRGGRELYFLSADYHVMVSTVTFSANGETVDIKPPAPLFPSALPAGSEFDVTADGERFLINTPLEEAPPIFILSNWPRAK